MYAGGKAMLGVRLRNNSKDMKLREIAVRFESVDDKSVSAVSTAKVNVYEESEAQLNLLVDVDAALTPGDYRVTAFEKGYDDYTFDDSAVGTTIIHINAATGKPVLRIASPVVWKTKDGMTEAVQGDDILVAANVRNYGDDGKVGIVAHLRDVTDSARDFVFIQTDATIGKGEQAAVSFYRKMVVDPGTYSIWFSAVDEDGNELPVETTSDEPTLITVGENRNIKLSVTSASLPDQLVIGERVSGSVTLHAIADFHGTVYVRLRQLTNRNGEIVTMGTKNVAAGGDINMTFNYRPTVAEGTYMLIVETKENGQEMAVGGCANYYRIIHIGNSTGIGSAATATDATAVARYSTDGTLLTKPQRGVNIVRMSDGTTRKVIVY